MLDVFIKFWRAFIRSTAGCLTLTSTTNCTKFNRIYTMNFHGNIFWLVFNMWYQFMNRVFWSQMVNGMFTIVNQLFCTSEMYFMEKEFNCVSEIPRNMRKNYYHPILILHSWMWMNRMWYSDTNAVNRIVHMAIIYFTSKLLAECFWEFLFIYSNENILTSTIQKIWH